MPKDEEIEEKKSDTISYEDKTVSELKEIAKEKEIKGYSKMTKDELIDSLNNLDK